MSRSLISKVAVAAAALAVALPITAGAATLAADDASDPTYAAGFDAGMNGGTGLQPWIINQELNSGRFVGDSGSNGFGDFNGNGDINTTGTLSQGQAWGLYANTGNLSDAIRPFNAPLKVGDTLSFSFDNGFVDNGGTVGIGLRNSSNENVFEIYFSGGDSFYKYTDAAGPTDSTLQFTSDGFDVVFTLTGATEYSVTTTILGGASDTKTGTLSAPAGGQVIDRIRFFNFNAGNGSAADYFFNKITITGDEATAVRSWNLYR
jgi:hypothetical protein